MKRSLSALVLTLAAFTWTGLASADGGKTATQETEDRNLGVGLGALVPTEGGPLNGGVEANFYPIYGEYLAGNGGGGGLRAYSTIWRFKVRWFGLGVHFYEPGAEMLSARHFERPWDIQPSVGFDTRLWKGFSLRLLATWSLASPMAVYKEARDSVDARIAYGKDLKRRALANPNDPAIQAELRQFQKQPQGSVDEEVRKLRDDTWVGALKRPSIWVGLRYSFDVL